MASNMTDPMAALKIATDISDKDKIRDLLEISIESGDSNLERALRGRAKVLGVIATPGKSETIAKRIQRQYDEQLAAQQLRVSGYRENRKAGMITDDFIREETNFPLFSINIEALTGDAQRNSDLADENYQTVLATHSTISHSSDPTQALLDETRAGKIWARFERQLTNSTDKLGVLTKAIMDVATNPDEALTLAVVLTEGPSYLEAAGVKNGGTVLESVARDNHPKLIEAHEQQIAAAKVLAVARHNASVIIKAAGTDPINMPSSTSTVHGYLSFDTAL